MCWSFEKCILFKTSSSSNAYSYGLTGCGANWMICSWLGFLLPRVKSDTYRGLRLAFVVFRYSL